MASIKTGENHVRVYHSLDSWHGTTYREDLERLAGVLSRMREQVFA
jgi:hypothetical protein